MIEFFKRHATTLFFPMALILYDFAAYLSTDLIQPGIINVVREFDADVSLAPAAVSLYLAGGMALQWLLGPLSDRIGRRPVLVTGALIFSLACTATLFTTSMTQFLIARVVQGTSICFIATVGYVTVQEAFGQTKAIKLMAIITSIVLVAPIIGPLSGAALMHFVHWKVLFAIIAVMGFIAFMGLLLAMPETVQRGAVPFSAISVVRDFRDVFRNRVFLFGVATISLSYIPMMSWVAVSPVILIDAGGMTSSQFAWVQVPVFGAVIVANMVVARFVKDPTNPRFIWRAVPIQL
ncbi:MFS transporter, partial [Citrobacter amalonaticus]